MQGKKKETSVKMVTVMQANRSCKKGCVLFVVHISSDKGNDVEDEEVLSRYQILQKFQDVFPIDISELTPHREVEISIDLVPREAPTSVTPYRMSTPNLAEMMLHLK